jgi:hypothetical protein
MPASRAAAAQVAEGPDNKKAPADAGAFKFLTQEGNQYFATTGPLQLKR